MKKKWKEKEVFRSMCHSEPRFSLASVYAAIPPMFFSPVSGVLRLPPTHVYIHTYSNPLRTQLSTCLFRSKTKSTKMVKWENSETGRGDGSYAYSSVCIQKRGNRKNTPRRGTTSKNVTESAVTNFLHSFV